MKKIFLSSILKYLDYIKKERPDGVRALYGEVEVLGSLCLNWSEFSIDLFELVYEDAYPVHRSKDSTAFLVELPVRHHLGFENSALDDDVVEVVESQVAQKGDDFFQLVGEQAHPLTGEIFVQDMESSHSPFLGRVNLHELFKGLIPFWAHVHVEDTPQLVCPHAVEVRKFQEASLHHWFGFCWWNYFHQQ